MPELLKHYIKKMKEAQTLGQFNKYDGFFTNRYNKIHGDEDFDPSLVDDGYMDALRQRSFLVRKTRRENKKN